MALATTAGFADQLDPEYNDIFFQNYTYKPEEYTKVFRVMDAPSGDRYSEASLSGLGTLEEIQEGETITYDIPVEGFEKTVYWREFGLGFQLSRVMLEDDLHGNLKRVPALLGRSASQTRETEAFDIFNSGFDTHTSKDGQFVFDTDHTYLNNSGATYQNEPTTASDLNETTLMAALEYFENLLDDQGYPITMTPKILLIPVDQWGEAKVLLGTDKKVGSADNDISKVSDEGLQWMIGHHLTSTTAWFVIAADADARFFWKRKTEFMSADDFGTGNALFKATMRFQVAVFDNRGLYGNPGA